MHFLSKYNISWVIVYTQREKLKFLLQHMQNLERETTLNAMILKLEYRDPVLEIANEVSRSPQIKIGKFILSTILNRATSYFWHLERSLQTSMRPLTVVLDGWSKPVVDKHENILHNVSSFSSTL